MGRKLSLVIDVVKLAISVKSIGDESPFLTCALSPVVLVGAVLEAGLEAALARPLHYPRRRHDGLGELAEVADGVTLHGGEAVVLVVVGELAPGAALADDAAAPDAAAAERGQLRLGRERLAAVLALALQALARYLWRFYRIEIRNRGHGRGHGGQESQDIIIFIIIDT